MELIKSNQRIEIFKSNQGMGLIKLSHDIQSWHLVMCPIKTDGMTLNRKSIISKGYPRGLKQKTNINS